MFFATQPEQVYGHLTTEDRTLMRFGADVGADLHCHMGAQRHALARIYDWLDDRLTPEAALPISSQHSRHPVEAADRGLTPTDGVRTVRNELR
jgi:hypothetical protein